MRLWERISRVFLQASTRLAWRASLRGRWTTTNDPQTALIRQLATTGTPVSLASVKAALDAASSMQDTMRSDKFIGRVDGLMTSAKSTSIRFV